MLTCSVACSLLLAVRAIPVLPPPTAVLLQLDAAPVGLLCSLVLLGTRYQSSHFLGAACLVLATLVICAAQLVLSSSHELPMISEGFALLLASAALLGLANLGTDRLLVASYATASRARHSHPHTPAVMSLGLYCSVRVKVGLLRAAIASACVSLRVRVYVQYAD
jgi:hypothetical protein